MLVKIQIKKELRPITLANILIALEESREEYYGIDTQGKIYSDNDDGYKIYEYWDLTKDLDGQSNETIKFIYKIINN